MKWCSGGTLATRVLFFRCSQTKKQPPVVFYKKGVLKKFVKSKGLRPATLLKNRLWQTCFSVNFEKFLRQLLLQTLVFFMSLAVHEIDVIPVYNRSSPTELFLVKGVLKSDSKFTGEYPCRSLISIKLLCNFIENALRHGCSPVSFLHIFRAPFHKNTSGGLHLYTNYESFHLKRFFSSSVKLKIVEFLAPYLLQLGVKFALL